MSFQGACQYHPLASGSFVSPPDKGCHLRPRWPGCTVVPHAALMSRQSTSAISIILEPARMVSSCGISRLRVSSVRAQLPVEICQALLLPRRLFIKLTEELGTADPV